LKTAIPDIARLLRAADSVGFMKTYLPPDDLAKIDDQRLQATQEAGDRAGFSINPSLLKAKESLALAVEDLESQRPTYNDAGDEASYEILMPGFEGQEPYYLSMVFVKINGKWYSKQGMGDLLNHLSMSLYFTEHSN